jgi:hypothetical protein
MTTLDKLDKIELYDVTFSYIIRFYVNVNDDYKNDVIYKPIIEKILQLIEENNIFNYFYHNPNYPYIYINNNCKHCTHNFYNYWDNPIKYDDGVSSIYGKDGFLIRNDGYLIGFSFNKDNEGCEFIFRYMKDYIDNLKYFTIHKQYFIMNVFKDLIATSWNHEKTWGKRLIEMEYNED